MDLVKKIAKFIIFLLWIAVLIILFGAFGWGGLIVGLVITGGAFSIFGNENF